MNWNDLVEVLRAKVPAGRVTTYAEVSEWAYGVRSLNHPVRSLLRGACTHGHQMLTNRVVRTDGGLAALPEGAEQQLEQLKKEGVPFTSKGTIDITKTVPVKLGAYIGTQVAPKPSHAQLEPLEQGPDMESEAAWDREIERRVAEVEAGTAKLIPAEDVHAEVRRLV